MTGLQATFDSFPVTRVLHLGVAMAGISTSQGVLLSAGVTQTTGSAQPGGARGSRLCCCLALICSACLHAHMHSLAHAACEC